MEAFGAVAAGLFEGAVNLLQGLRDKKQPDSDEGTE